MASNYEYEDAAPASYDEAQRQSGQDAAYDPNAVPDSVKSFVVHMYRHIREKNVYEIHQMCETSFQTLSERLFKDTPWPSVEAIAPYVDNDHVFCLLYREMWFRHLYARLSPTLKQRLDSYDNYCSLFQVVLHGVVNMQLPNQWLWDMVDEFVYQFQSFCQYRTKMKNKTEQEIALLKQNDKVNSFIGCSRETLILDKPQAITTDLLTLCCEGMASLFLSYNFLALEGMGRFLQGESLSRCVFVSMIRLSVRKHV